MSFLSCEEMLAAARSQNLSLAEAILRSDLAESRLTEEASRHAMHHLWHVMEPPAGSMTLPSAAAAACPAAMPPRWNRPIRRAEAMAGITLLR